MSKEIKSTISKHYDQDGVWDISDPDEYYCYRREEEEFDRLLKGYCKGRLLEVGAGRGRYAIRYADHFDSIVAIDISKKMVERIGAQAKEKGLHNIRLIQSDAESLNFKDSVFDAVIAPQLIGLCPNPETVLKEMYRVLKKNGRGIFSTPNYLSINLLKQLGSIRDCFLKDGKIFLNFRDYKKNTRLFWLNRQNYVRDSFFSVNSFMRSAGIKIDKISGAGIFPTLLSKRLKPIERRSARAPFKYFCRTIIVGFTKK